MKFKNLRLLREVEVHSKYFAVDGEGTVVVGKVRPWDATDREYILYGDGDLVLADADEEEGSV